MGLEASGHECVGFCEFDRFARQSYKAIFNTEEGWENHDVRTVCPMELPRADLWCFGFPCFTAGTLVKTNKGLTKIEDLTVGDMVLTHLNRYRPIVQTMHRDVDKVYKIKAMGCDEIITTENHPFWVRHKHNIWLTRDKRGRRFDEPQWIKAKDLTKDYYLSIPVNQESKPLDVERIPGSKNPIPIENDIFYWFLGRWLGDGWIYRGVDNKRNRVILCCGKQDVELLKWKLKDFMPYCLTEARTCFKFTYSSRELYEFLDKFGVCAGGKVIPQEVLDMPINKLKIVLDGYVSADGSFTEGIYKCTTISRKLAYGIAACVNKVYHRACAVYRHNVKPTTVIEGRVVNQQTQYQMCFNKDNRKQDKAFYEDGFVYVPISKIVVCEEKHTVYNIGVEEDESYTANSVGVHNCQDISVAGKQKGLLEGERSNLFFQIIRLLQGVPKENKPKWLLAENVKNLLSVGRGWDFARCICALGEAGYDIEWQLFNTKFAYNVAGVCVPGIPQNRERVYLVGRLVGDGCGRKVFPIQRADTKNPLELQEITEGLAQFHRVYKDEGVAPSLMCSITKTARIATEAKAKQIGHIEGYGIDNPQAYRVYDKEQIAPTLTRSADGKVPHVLADNPSGKIENLGSYYPSGYNATMVVDSKGIAPTVRENHGQVTATVVKAVLTPDREEKRQNGRRIKEDGEPMFTLTTQDRHGVAIEIGHEVGANGKVMQSSKVYDTDGISPTLCAGHGSTIPNVLDDMPSVIGGIGEPNDFGKQFRQGNRIYSADHVSPALVANNGNASGGSVLIEEPQKNEADTDCNED